MIKSDEKGMNCNKMRSIVAISYLFIHFLEPYTTKYCCPNPFDCCVEL